MAAMVIRNALVLLAVHAFLRTTASIPTVEIADGVNMPMVNLGTCCGSEATNSFPVWYAAGGRGVDTALDYGKECPGGTQAELGAAIVKSGAARSSVFITTKIRAGLDIAHLGSRCLLESAEYALKAVQQDLKELNVPQVDLVLLHGPCKSDATNFKLWQGLEQALEQNLTRAIGVSNYDSKQLAALLGQSGIKVKPAINQCHLSIATHNDDDIAYCNSQGVTYEAYEAMKGCPFTDSKTQAIAKAHNVQVSQVCLRWVLQKGAIMAVGLGKNVTNMPSYAKGNLDLFGFNLTAQEITYLDSLATNKTVESPPPEPAQCKADADCPCSYCMNDKTKSPPYSCHPPTPGVCCTTDADCPGSYCVNYPGKTRPFHCHGN